MGVWANLLLVGCLEINCFLIITQPLRSTQWLSQCRGDKPPPKLHAYAAPAERALAAAGTSNWPSDASTLLNRVQLDVRMLMWNACFCNAALPGNTAKPAPKTMWRNWCSLVWTRMSSQP